jgi:CRISPR/Cas system-associated exonuclease Cas4 (RecB family)
MKDLIQPIYDKVREKIQRFPCYTNRASQIGYFVPELGGCIRYGVYNRTHWDKKEMWSVESTLRLEEGNLQEREVLKALILSNASIISGPQKMWLWEEYQISGHLDAVYVEDNISYPLEIKSMSPTIFQQMKTFEDFKKKPWTRSYIAQIMMYMMFKNVDKGIFVLKDKSSGELRQIVVDLDYDLAEACIKTAETINKHIDDGTLPGRIDDRQKCCECPFKLVCLPEISFGEELKIVDDPMIEKRIKKYFELKNISAECDNIYDIIKSESKAQAIANGGGLNQMVGAYHLSGKIDSRGAFRLKIESV